MLWIKPKEVLLECFTSNSSVFDLAKPDHAVKFVPDWWKDVPPSFVGAGAFFKSPTIKKCSGFIENFKHGLMLPMWSDLSIELGRAGTVDYRWQYSDFHSELETHSFEQINNYLDPKQVFHAKLMNPWAFKCKEDTPWMWSNPTWNMLGTNHYVALPGVVDYKYQHSVHVNLLFSRGQTTKVIEIPFRMPLVQITPLTERRLKVKHHLVSQKELDDLKNRSRLVTFVGKYSTIKNILKGNK